MGWSKGRTGVHAIICGCTEVWVILPIPLAILSKNDDITKRHWVDLWYYQAGWCDLHFQQTWGYSQPIMLLFGGRATKLNMFLLIWGATPKSHCLIIKFTFTMAISWRYTRFSGTPFILILKQWKPSCKVSDVIRVYPKDITNIISNRTCWYSLTFCWYCSMCSGWSDEQKW